MIEEKAHPSRRQNRQQQDCQGRGGAALFSQCQPRRDAHRRADDQGEAHHQGRHVWRERPGGEVSGHDGDGGEKDNAAYYVV